MQDRYAGDVGDFGKFGLLKSITSANLKLGINWYLTDNENHNEDGKHKTNATKSYCNCDIALASQLEKIANDERSVANLEKLNILPNTIYYNRRLKLPSQYSNNRSDWHKNALDCLKNCDIVFLDPDNGLKVKSVGYGSKKSVKYVFDSEIKDYYSSGQSVIFYNHRKRVKEDIYLIEFSEYFKHTDFHNLSWYALTFRKGTLRDYFILAQPKHKNQIESAINMLINSEWNNLFYRLK